jgi:hypothetical protein
VLVLLAVAAFSGWYLIVENRSNDTGPLPVVQRPLMPPASTDLTSELPGHTHYTVVSPQPDQEPHRANP